MSARCPFCGSRQATISEISPREFAVCCPKCGAVGPAANYAPLAEAGWAQAFNTTRGRKSQVRRTAETRARAAAIVRHARAIADLYDDGGGS